MKSFDELAKLIEKEFQDLTSMVEHVQAHLKQELLKANLSFDCEHKNYETLNPHDLWCKDCGAWYDCTNSKWVLPKFKEEK
jgi:hypothetical protein